MGPQGRTMHHAAVVNNGFSSHGGNGQFEKEGEALITRRMELQR